MIKYLRTLRARWRAKTPLFWAKIYKISARLVVLQSFLLFLLGNMVVMQNIPSWLISFLQCLLSASIVSALYSKLTVEDPKEIENESNAPQN